MNPRKIAILVLLAAFTAIGCNTFESTPDFGDGSTTADGGLDAQMVDVDGGEVVDATNPVVDGGDEDGDGGDGGRDGGGGPVDWSRSGEASLPTLISQETLQECDTETLSDQVTIEDTVAVDNVISRLGRELIVSAHRESTGELKIHSWNGSDAPKLVATLPNAQAGPGKVALATIAEQALVTYVGENGSMNLVRCSFVDLPGTCESQMIPTEGVLSVAASALGRLFRVYQLQQTSPEKMAVKELQIDYDDLGVDAEETLQTADGELGNVLPYIAFGWVGGKPSLGVTLPIDGTNDYYRFFQQNNAQMSLDELPDPISDTVQTDRPKLGFDNAIRSIQGVIDETGSTRRLAIWNYDGSMWEPPGGFLEGIVGFDYLAVEDGNLHAYVEPTRLKINSRVEGSFQSLVDIAFSASEFGAPIELAVLDGDPVMVYRDNLGALRITHFCVR